MAEQFDILIKNASIIDGSGGPRRTGSVGVRSGKIAAVGDLPGATAAAMIDASGHVLCPGFIDAHSHSDFPLLIDPRGQSKIRQGVTTEIVGNCGFSPAPVSSINRAGMIESNRFLAAGAELDWTWDSMGGYLDRLEGQRVSMNVLALVGHVALRSAVMGYQKRYASAEELGQMKDLLRASIEGGAFGFSTGLIFPPSSYSDTEELVELARVLAEYSGIYFSHIRGEGHGLLRAVAEAIEIGERAGVSVQIAHHKASGRAYWGRVRDSLAMIEAARGRGVDVMVDVYPYPAGSGGLTQVVPEWAHEGGPEVLLNRLRDRETRGRIEQGVSKTWEWDRTFVCWTASNDPAVVGKSLAEIARARNAQPLATALDILTEERLHAAMVHFGMSDDDVRYVLKHPLAMIGSDGSAISPEPPLNMGKPHPRFYGAFPRVLGRYAREERLFTLEEAVHKMSGLTAARMGLKSKGLIASGRDADMVVFDEERVLDRATFEDPHQFPEGIEYVIVNGRVAVSNGVQTAELAGRVLRGPKAA